MQLALLSGASPLTCKQGPVVRLQAGTWEISVDGLIDSVLVLHRNFHTENVRINHGRIFTLHDACEAKVEFVERGSERHISINVKKVA